MIKLRRQNGFALRGLLLSFFIISLVLSGFLYTFGKIVPPGYMGLRQIFYGPGKGYADNTLPPGFHWNVPLYSEIYLIPETIQYSSFKSVKNQEQKFLLQ